MARRRAHSTAAVDLVTALVRVAIWPLRVCRVAFAPLNRWFERRDERVFLQQLKDASGELLARHGGQIRVQRRRVQAFDYRSAELEFTERTITITRGRGEVRILVDGAEVFSSLGEEYAASMRRQAELLGSLWSADEGPLGQAGRAL